VAAGSVGQTLIGRLPGKSLQIGPIAGISYRVASRIANSLPTGRAVRRIADLASHAVILFHAPPDQICSLLDLCLHSAAEWRDKTIVFCDCEPPNGVALQFHVAGAATAVARTFGVPGFAMVRGCAPALPCARRIVRAAGLKPLEIHPEGACLFAAAITLGTAAITPIIDRVAYLLRSAGLRDADSIKVAESLFQQTTRGYAHSGRQSWVWHMSRPCGQDLLRQIDALDGDLKSMMRQLLLLGFDTFGRHAETASFIRGDHRDFAVANLDGAPRMQRSEEE
jgi:hypothetical protein